MARKKQGSPSGADFILSAQKAATEHRKVFERDDSVRTAAASRLLRPDEVAGDIDAGKLLRLTTSLRGGHEPLTIEDLRLFQQNIRSLKGRFKKGIKAKDVIDLSTQADRNRAHTEIRSALPVSTRAGEIKFMTNAGPDSDRKRHYVTVKLLNFEAAVISPIQPEKIIKEVIDGPIAMACDCGRWRFWYAFLATTGGYNAGHRENAYPKIRNPELNGVACKHILRVMTSIVQSPSMRNYLLQLIHRERDAVERKVKRERIADMQELHDQMTEESWRQRAVRTSGEKRETRESSPAAQKRKEAAAEKARQKATEKAARNIDITGRLAGLERTLRAVPGMSELVIKAALAARLKELKAEDRNAK